MIKTCFLCERLSLPHDFNPIYAAPCGCNASKLIVNVIELVQLTSFCRQQSNFGEILPFFCDKKEIVGWVNIWIGTLDVLPFRRNFFPPGSIFAFVLSFSFDVWFPRNHKSASSMVSITATWSKWCFDRKKKCLKIRKSSNSLPNVHAWVWLRENAIIDGS